MFNRFSEYPQNHVTITPSDANNLDRLMMIYCGSTGNIVVQDANGTQITYVAAVGLILPILVKKVMATNTTVTQVIGLY
jgi:hypothetical protein